MVELNKFNNDLLIDRWHLFDDHSNVEIGDSTWPLEKQYKQNSPTATFATSPNSLQGGRTRLDSSGDDAEAVFPSIPLTGSF